MRAIKKWKLNVGVNTRVVAECTDGTLWLLLWQGDSSYGECDGHWKWTQLPDIPKPTIPTAKEMANSLVVERPPALESSSDGEGRWP